MPINGMQLIPLGVIVRAEIFIGNDDDPFDTALYQFASLIVNN